MSSEVLDRLDAVVDELLSLDPDALRDDEVVEIARRLERARRRTVTVDHAVINQMAQRSLPAAHGCRTAAVFLSNLLRIGRAEATARVAAAEALGLRRTVIGQLVAPRFPVIAAAQTAGAVSDRHAAVIVRAVDKLPDAIADEFGEFVEQTLVEHAAEMDPVQLHQQAAALTYALDQDGQLADDRYRDRTRGFAVHRRPDGSSRVEGELTAEATEYLLAVLDPLTKPEPAEAGPDPRTASQRRHDALLAACKAALRARLLPNVGGVSASVVLVMDADSWVTGEGSARTGHGYTVPAAVAKRWTNFGFDARFVLALLSKTKAVEAYSSTQRIFTEQQRLAMIARDGGCSFENCDAPPAYTEAHHVTESQQGGPTSVSNGTLACCFNHRHTLTMGWRVIMLDGVPHWIPPSWLDPEQKPRRNRRHDRPR